MRKKRTKRKKIYFDYGLLAVLICLICFGLVMLYSSSAYSALVKYNDSMYYFKRQLIFCIAGAVGAGFIVKVMDYHWFFYKAKLIYFTSIFLMLLVQTPLGKEVNGARRWLRLPGGFTLQPAELAKVAVILFIPFVICKLGKEIHTVRGFVQMAVWGGLSFASVLFLTENLSTAIIVVGITGIVYFVAHRETEPFLRLLVFGAVLVAVFVAFVGITMNNSADFRMRRIITWLNPEQYASEGAYQTLQGLYAIGSGGFFGKGLGNSVQKTIIPEVQNDMILSVICEELGVFGAIIILVLFGMLLYRLLFIAQNAPDFYGSLVATGIFAHIALQVTLNVAVVTNTIPNTGITLPFISYGGTSFLFLMAEMGIALNISSKIKFEE